MEKIGSIFFFAIVGSLCFLSDHSYAADLSWSGRYRIEGVQINNSDLSSANKEKSYFLHHLILNPRIIASDGIEVRGRFDLLNSDNYSNSQVGQFFGNGPGGSPIDSTSSNVLSRTQKDETLQIKQLYINWANEYGIFVGGRVPIQFGLGMTHNDGSGDFDHWLNTKDLVAYKMIAGNFTLIPMYGKVEEGSLTDQDDVNDYMFELLYDLPDNYLSLGLFYESRVAGRMGNDAPSSTTGSSLGGTGSTVGSGYNAQTLSIFVARRYPVFGFAIEGGFTTGKTGVLTTSGSTVTYKGIGFATEFYWKPQGSFSFGAKAGMASGDDPTTDASYEGFSFNPNYDVAMLLFNHRLGQYDIFRTSLDRSKSNIGSVEADTEYLSNVLYIAPTVDWKWNEKLSLNTRLIYGLLQEVPNSETSKDLGFELDFGATYSPFERLSWVSEIGILFPGNAFRGGTLGFESKNVFAFSTKATISF